MKRAKKIDVTKSKLHHTLLPIDPKTGNVLTRFRSLNKNRGRAMRAIVLAMLYHYDMKSHLVNASVERLSDECGLSTLSQSGNKSITRASRLINQFMEPMGFIQCKKIKDISTIKMRKKIFLTPFFFMLFNISPPTINRHLYKKNSFFKKSNMKDKKIFIPFKETEMISPIDERSIRNKILKILINYYTASELTEIGAKGLKKKIDIEYNNLCKMYKDKK